jgi:cell division protein FtsZ
MYRRQFLQTLNANGMGALLPTSALANISSRGESHVAIPPAAEVDSVVVEVAGTTWDIPKIGILSVGGIGGSCLPTADDLTQSLPFLSRTIAVHTYGVELHFMKADRKVLVGDSKTRLNPHTAGLLAHSVIPEIADAVAGLDMVLLIAGMGGTTGTGVAPVVAQVLREQGILTLAFAVMPFDREGMQRRQTAQTGIRELRSHVDALIPFLNNDFDPDAKHVKWQSTAVKLAPLTFMQVCRNIMNTTCRPGLVNVDFEDLRHIILNQDGDCAFGFGSASSRDGAEAAAVRAIDHPLLGRGRLQRTAAVLMTISASPQVLLLRDPYDAVRTVRKLLSPNAHVIYGAYCDQTLGNNIAVSILANG